MFSNAFFTPHSKFPAVKMKMKTKELESGTNGKVQIDVFCRKYCYGNTLKVWDDIHRNGSFGVY
ncbi:hypothetical protein CSV75_14040 [Sporosarcina sp. P18a]|nr:hypothetical protein CSV75_14040 [Sporosarcina sp. P18a]